MPRCSWCPRTATRTEGNSFACREHASRLRPTPRPEHERSYAFRSAYRPYDKTLYRKKVS